MSDLQQHLMLNAYVTQICWFPSKVGVRQGCDERDRRAGHPALLRLALPHGTGED